jgi:hypothetical protein
MFMVADAANGYAMRILEAVQQFGTEAAAA